MPYNTQNAEEVKGLPPGISAEGVVTILQDGVTKDFVVDTTNWKGDVNQPCIEVTVETKHENNTYTIKKIFNYRYEEGKTKFTQNSNMGKYFKYYTKLPQVGDRVRLLTNAEGFWRILLE